MISIKDLIDRFASTATKGDAGLFIGSGVSVPSNGPTWKQLFYNTARDLDIKIKDTDDLALIAQYGVNANQGNRGPLIAAVREKTGQTSGPNRLHHSI